jgi:hypothetical protein
MDRRITEERFAEMKAIAEKTWLTETYRGSDPSGVVEIRLSEFGDLHRALLEAVHELERFYGNEC